jgi:hypothetical protein
LISDPAMAIDEAESRVDASIERISSEFKLIVD